MPICRFCVYILLCEFYVREGILSMWNIFAEKWAQFHFNVFVRFVDAYNKSNIVIKYRVHIYIKPMENITGNVFC